MSQRAASALELSHDIRCLFGRVRGVASGMGKRRVGTDSMVVTGCFLTGVEMCPGAAEAAESSSVFGHTVSDSVIIEHFVI